MNIPNLDVNNGKDKDVKPFIAPRSPRMVDIYFPDGGEFGVLNVECNTMICLMHPYKKYVDISFTEIKNPNNKLWYSDKVHITSNRYYHNHNKKKHLRNINITSHSEEQINNVGKQSTSQNNQATNSSTTSTSNKQIEEYKKQIKQYKSQLENTKKSLESKETELNSINAIIEEEAKYTTINCIAVASKSDSSYKVTYTLMCGNCKVIIEPTTSLTHEGIVKSDQYFHNGDEIFEALGGNTSCENEECKKKFSKDKINIITQSTSYLKFEPDETNTKRWNLYCSICNSTPLLNIDDYNSIDDLKSKANNYHDFNCNCESLHFGVEEISVNELETYASKIPLTITGNCDAKFDYDINSTIYTNYSNLQCSNEHSLSGTAIALANTKIRPQDLLFNEIYCQECNQSFTAQDISVTISYLCPENDTKYDEWIELRCSNCISDQRSPHDACLKCNFAKNPPEITRIYGNNKYTDFPCDGRCGATCVWNDEYIIGELIKIKEKYYHPQDS